METMIGTKWIDVYENGYATVLDFDAKNIVIRHRDLDKKKTTKRTLTRELFFCFFRDPKLNSLGFPLANPKPLKEQLKERIQ